MAINQINQKKAQKDLGDIIREWREGRGFSQEGFAAECGIHRTYMGGIERGERNVALKNIRRIAEGMEMKPSELLAKAGL